MIEDDRQVRSLFVSHLSRNGWQTYVAEDGETGLELARQHRPEAIICDLLLPRTNGFMICKALRSELGLKETRIIAVSGRCYVSNRQAALEAGADEFLPKPVQLQELDDTLERLLKATERPPESPVEAPVESGGDETVVRFWGVRGSVPVPGATTIEYGGNTSCVEIRAEEELIILDSGTGIRPLGTRLVEEFKDRPLELTILITHTHWDHIQGFPFFQPAYQAKNRIQILGYEGARSHLSDVFVGQMESPYFPIGFNELPGSIDVKELKDMEFQLGRVRVEAAFMNHPGICMGYRLHTRHGSVAYLPDNEPFARNKAESDTQFSFAHDRLAYAAAEEQKMLEFVRDADLLIMDAQYDAEEYKVHVGWGHGCLDEVVRLALRANVRHLVLFHHDPEHDDEKLAAMTAHARKMVAASKSKMIVEAAREGVEIRLAGREHPVNGVSLWKAA